MLKAGVFSPQLSQWQLPEERTPGAPQTMMLLRAHGDGRAGRAGLPCTHPASHAMPHMPLYRSQSISCPCTLLLLPISELRLLDAVLPHHPRKLQLCSQKEKQKAKTGKKMN